MNPAYRLLGASVLATWFLSLLLWLNVVVIILTFDFTEAWHLGFIAFVLSFTCMVVYLTFWWRNGPNQSLASRFVRSSLLTTWLYSLMLFGYLVARVVVNQVSIHSPFIDVLLPWFTFLRLGILAFILSLLSFLAYLALFWRSDDRSVAQRFS